MTKVLCDSTNYFGAVTRLPDLVIVMATKTTVFADHLAVRDAAKMLIPSVAICDSNSDPRLVSHRVKEMWLKYSGLEAVHFRAASASASASASTKT